MRRHLFIFPVLLLLTPALLHAQSQDFGEMRDELVQRQQDTRAEIEDIEAQIETYQERLVLAEERYDRLFNQYEDLNRVIALQEEKILKLETEQSHILEEIDITEQEIDQNREILDGLIENYKNTLRYLYKNGRTSQLALILSASSFNQMLVRSFYLNRFEEHRQEQARTIRETTRQLEESRTSLEDARDRNARVLEEIITETEELAARRDRQEENVALLRQDREQIESSLAEARSHREEMNNTLDFLIAEEERVREEMEARIRALEEERMRRLAEARNIEDDAEREREIARYSEPVSSESFVSEDRLLSMEESFASQKGTLRWPVESSTISEHFGRHRHPVYGTITENLGVEIVTSPNDSVRVVHDGYVMRVQPLPGYGDVVVVNHGKYITAYGNLSRVLVRNNTVLEAGDIIGLSGDQNSAKGETVFFMVREGNTNLDPEAWLVNKS